jgi:hypothetical protein
MPRTTRVFQNAPPAKACTLKTRGSVGLETATDGPAESHAARPLSDAPLPRPHADFTTGTPLPDGFLPEPASAPCGEGWRADGPPDCDPPSALGTTAGT